MKHAVVILLVCLTALTSCKKDEKDNEAEVPFPTALTHSGVYHGTISLYTATVTEQLLTVRNLDGFGIRQCDISVWVKGPYLDQIDAAIDTTMYFHLSVIIVYNSSEMDQNGTPPPLTAARLAQAINDGQYSWNDGSEMKDMSFVFCAGGGCSGFVGGNEFNIENPGIVATHSANTIRLQGGVDLISVIDPETFDEEFVTDWAFDYTFVVE